MIYPHLPCFFINYTYWTSGFFGVEMFFVLSGFLIGNILVRIYDQEQKLNFSLIVDFWKRRWFRTLPNYYLTLIIFILLNYFEVLTFHKEKLISVQQVGAYFLFLQNFYVRHMKIFVVSWSLSVEEWFYLLLPLIILLFQLIPKIKARDRLYIMVLSIISLVFTYRTLAMFNGIEVVHIVIYRLDAIIYGVGMAVIHYYHPHFWKRNAANFLIAGIFIFLINNYIHFKYIITGSANRTIYASIASFPLTSLSFALFLPYFNSIKQVKGYLGKIITNISIVSYSMYLNHSIISIGILPYLIYRQSRN